MKTYEALVIFPFPSAGELHQVGKDTFEEVVKKHEGTILNRTELGKRPLGYPVRKAREGYVASFAFELLPGKMDSLKRSLHLTEGILKFTVVKKPKVRWARQLKPVSSPAVAAGPRRERSS